MPRVLDPFRFVLIAISGWMNQHQLADHRLPSRGEPGLREQLAGRRMRFNDGQRRRLAAKAKGLDEGFCRDRNHRHSRDLIGLASEADRH